MTELFVKHYGKDSPNATTVKHQKLMFPHGIDLENNSSHQELFREMKVFCGDFACHKSHLEASIIVSIGNQCRHACHLYCRSVRRELSQTIMLCMVLQAAAETVHSQHGLTGKLLMKKASHDATEARDAMAKLCKTLYNWSRSEKPRRNAWQKCIFGEDHIEKSIEDKKTPSQEGVAKKQHAKVADMDSSSCGGKTTAAPAEKVKFFISTADLKITITVNANPTSPLSRIMEVIIIIDHLPSSFASAPIRKTQSRKSRVVTMRNSRVVTIILCIIRPSQLIVVSPKDAMR